MCPAADVQVLPSEGANGPAAVVVVGPPGAAGAPSVKPDDKATAKAVSSLQVRRMRNRALTLLLAPSLAPR